MRFSRFSLQLLVLILPSSKGHAVELALRSDIQRSISALERRVGQYGELSKSDALMLRKLKLQQVRIALLSFWYPKLSHLSIA